MGIIKKFIDHTKDMAKGFLGDITGTRDANRMTRQNNALQQSNFENQTQIRVRDALKAGINPLAALGISSGYQPTFGSAQTNSATDMVNMIGSTAGAIGGAARGIANWFTGKAKEGTELNLEHQRLQNDYLRSQIQHLNSLAAPGVPSTPVPVHELPHEVGVDDEIINAMVRVRNRDGSISYYPSPAMADILDVEFSGGNPYAWQHVGENKIFTSFGSNRRASDKQKVLDWWIKSGRPKAYNRRTGKWTR
ncbi:DNA pilot protein [Dipodfec virus UOA04_Rod_962]|nr:DNA pilot protein [Dipodfec virus UOA04_Rod_962]